MAKNRNREVIVNEPPVVLEQSSDHSPEKAVRQAIASLPKIYREIVILRYYNRMSYEQMEMVLDIPKSKVKGRLFAARLKIRKYLHRKGLDGDY
jgi:RNA polymerase sigma-70 factor (ECF subfamily)